MLPRFSQEGPLDERLICYLQSQIGIRMYMPGERIAKVIDYSLVAPPGYRFQYHVEYEDTGEKEWVPVQGVRIGSDWIF